MDTMSDNKVIETHDLASPKYTSTRKTVKLVFFSGTGGTARVTSFMEQSLKNQGLDVKTISLDLQDLEVKGHAVENMEQPIDLLILTFAVHAFDAPEPVYEWIRKLPLRNGLPVAVISVSGGGEVWPNTACRVGCIGAFKRRGYDVFYERMMVMPSNWIVATKNQLAIRLLQILPIKVDHCISEILLGVRRRTHPPITARIMAALFKLEKLGAKLFGKDLTVRKSCTGCRWCTRNCPRGNIKIVKGRPSFGWKCVLCLRCVYGCPVSAIHPRICRFITVRGGYDLKALEKRMIGVDLESVETLATGVLYSGLRDYLLREEI